MIRLTRVEVKRLLARRVTWVALVGGLVLSGLVLFGINDQVKWMGSIDRTEVEQTFKRVHDGWVKNHKAQEASCRAGLPEGERSGASADERCAIPEPRMEDFLPAGVDHLYQEAATVLLPMSGFVCFLLGASLVAAEFSTRSMSTWLAFEPRRGRVAGSKLVAAVLGAAALGAVMVLVVGVGIWLIAGRVGLTESVSSATTTEILSLFSRLPVVAALSGLFGASLAFILRHTSAALGALIAYAVGAEGMIRGIVPTWQEWLASTNAMAFLKGGHTYEIFSCDMSGCRSTTEVVSFAQGTTYLVVAAVALTALGVLSFRRRDVT